MPTDAAWPSVPRERFETCGVPIDSIPIDEAVAQLANRSVRGPVHLCNAYTLSLAARSADLRDVLRRAARNHPDGMPLVWMARRLGLRHLGGRVYGPELMRRTLDHGRAHGVRHHLYGGDTRTIDLLVGVIHRTWPGCVISATPAPRTDDLTTFEADFPGITAHSPDIVWVGLGTPKQDFVVDRLAAAVPNAACVAVGAAFDFIAGTKRSAPAWIGNLGLEWAYRLATEPRRLWRRYLIGNVRFLRAARHTTRLIVGDRAGVDTTDDPSRDHR
jgi:N-acetylglucosaminyldiphosphoundecaprenol N-acetyl-beta-D-mannosaminyltransferase